MSEPVQPIPLAYSSLRSRRAPVALYYLTGVLGILPMLVGTVCLLGFYFTEEDSFAVTGFMTLIYGGGAVFLGLILGLVYFSLAGHATIEPELSRKRGKRALWILFANIPLAIFCTITGSYLFSHPTIQFQVQNNGTLPMLNGVFQLADSRFDLPTVLPGNSYRFTLRSNNGRVMLCYKNDSAQVDRQLLPNSGSFTFPKRTIVVIEVNDQTAQFKDNYYPGGD